MAALQQKKWLRKKAFEITSESELIITESRPFKTKVRRMRLTEIHPCHERYQNNALGYLFGCGLLILLLLASVMAHLPSVHSGIFFWSSVVMFVLYKKNNVAKVQFYGRSDGKTLFQVWQTRRQSERVFVTTLTEQIRAAYEARYANARKIINSRMRQSTAEDASYFLYRQELIDFPELESLVLNIDKRFQRSDDKTKSGNNVVELAAFKKEKVNEC